MLLLALAGMLLLSGFNAKTAAAEPFKFTFDEGIINLGSDSATQGLKLIDPGATPPDQPATLTGDVDGSNAFSAPASGFIFPDKTIQASGQNVLVKISASGPISGTMDQATGVADIDLPVTVQLSVLGSTCTTSFPLDLQTTGTLTEPGGTHDAAPFDPATGEGALYSPTNIPPTSGGGLCGVVDGLIGGAGAIWLSGIGAPDDGISTVYPGGEGTSLATTDGGWTSESSYTVLCGPTAGLLCPAINGSYVASGGTGGGSDGFLRDSVTGVLALPTAIGGDSTAVWTSPVFTYNGAEGEPAQSLSFSLARQADVTDLLTLANATWSVNLVKVSDSSVIPLVPDQDATQASTWTTQPGQPLAPDALTMGDDYRIEITSSTEVDLLGLIPNGSFSYDDVALVASRPTPTGPTGPTGPTDPTGPTGPTGPTSPTGPTGPIDWPPNGNPPVTKPPNGSTAMYDGEFLYLRLKCPARFKPRCAGNAVAVTKRSKKRKLAKPMTAARSAAQKAGKWKVVKLKVKPKFKKRINGFAKRPKKKLLFVRQTVKAKKFKKGKRQTVFHKYKVRRATN